MRISETAKAWLNGRGITDATLSKWPVVSATVGFKGKPKESVIFNYLRGSERLNYKARSIVGKDFTQAKDGTQCFWNLERVMNGAKTDVYIVEGEMDALALAECGIPDEQILSVPGGAPPEKKGEGSDPFTARRYEFVLDALGEGLTAERFIICTDNDQPGRLLKQDLVALLGAARCWHVEFPEGIKDANQALMEWGPEDTRLFVVDGAKEWPVVGVYRLEDLPTPPKITLWEPGFPEWERKVMLAPSMLSVFTGYPGHGKTQLSQQLWYNIASKYDVPISLFSAETAAKPYVQRTLRQLHNRQLEYQMDPAGKKRADDWINDHFYFIAHPNSQPRFDWVLDMIEVSAQRYGCRAFVLDPWNKLEDDYDRRTQSETQWIGACLNKLLDAARGLDIHIMVLAHPAKPLADAKKYAPDLYSISGSSMWFNRVDQGFCIHRPEVVGEDGTRKTEAKFLHLKARVQELGYPCSLDLRMDLDSGRYVSTDYETRTEKILNSYSGKDAA